MTSLQTVIHQNQQTIAFIEAKDYYSAIVSSSSALECLGSIPLILQRQENSSCSSPSEEETALDQCMLHTTIQENDDICGTQTFMYSHAIPLPHNVTDYAIITLVLIFNAALAHHLVAMQDKENSPRFLFRAKQLYTLAYHSQDVEHNPLFLFVVYNNAALIDLQQIGDKDSWNACVGHLVSIYMVMMDEGYTSQVRHLHGFLESLLATSMPARPPAAA
ncbi:unnamed protein product [Cylindrotheca closterium]|uniref:Uncharacterized protein n=1 Tax=Cylindrotheca closterium TaxID=2856 RepID=A0AAD2FRU5_9STRA|nr:unnamed protein product [Cylindrotheca closterium]